MLDAIERSLLARMANGDDDAASLLADHWIACGDRARGRFIQVERALEDRPRDDELKAERRHLLRKHRERWWAPALAAGFPPAALGFVGGFLATPLVLDPDEPDAELRRLSPVIYRDDGESGCSYHYIRAARVTTAETDDAAAVLLKTCRFDDDELAPLHAQEIADPLPANRLAGCVHANMRDGKVLVLPGGTDLASVLGVRTAGEPPPQRPAGRALGLPCAVSVGVEVCRALIQLHGDGEHHGRLTPENILLDRSGGATVVSLYPTVGWTDSRVWRHEWMWHLSPEQLSAGAVADARTDVFALGLIMATLIEGRHPALGAASELELVRALHDRRLVVPELPETIATVLQGALADGEHRFADATALGHALLAAARADGIHCGPDVIAVAVAGRDAGRARG